MGIRARIGLVLAAAVLVSLLAASSASAFGFITAWGTTGSGPSQFSQPGGDAVDAAGNVYVADRGNNRIQKFSPAGALLTQWGQFGTADGDFESPNGVATDAAGDVYVVEDVGNRVQEFTSSGAFVTKWGTTGSGNSQFNAPRALTVDSAGNVYVLDSNNERVQKFTGSGSYISQFGGSGTGDGQLTQGADGIAVDAAGNTYVSDTFGAFPSSHVHRIEEFSPAGTFLNKFGSFGTGDGQFKFPQGLALDAAGNVWVSDSSNNRLEEFTAGGTFLSTFGGPGTGAGQFSSPDGLAFNCRGSLYVVDTSNNRVQELGEAGTPNPPCPPAQPGATKPSNAFSFGKLTRNRKKGTAILAVELPGPGTVTLRGKGVASQRPVLARGRRSATKTVGATGALGLLVKAQGKTGKKLRKTGKAKVTFTVTFTPTAGDPNAQTRTVKLLKNR